MDEPPILEDRPRWEEAASFSDLCELMAQYIEGQIGYRPGYVAASLAEESDEIRSYLAAFNRAGFLTEDSQPGRSDQRAAVEGFALREAAARVALGLLKTELLVVAREPGHDLDLQIPITLDQGEPFTWYGYLGWEYQYQLWEDDCSAGALRSLKGAWKVMVIDLKWGRREYLWDVLAAVLDPSVIGSYEAE